jgi:gluconolactonase
MIFAENLGEPEGPVALDDGSWLVVEMAPERGRVTQIDGDGRVACEIARTGRPNGLAVDGNGTIWVAESGDPSLIRLDMDGRAEVVLTSCEGEPFLFPNDLCFGPDGALYMTDSGLLFEDFAPGGEIREDFRNAEIDGRVYRIDPSTWGIEKIDSGLRFTNGIAFGPDKNLYTNDTFTGMVYRYRYEDGRIVGGREDFANVVREESPNRVIGPDGMAFGTDGNLYVSVFGQGDVTVLSPSGDVVERIETAGNLPTNVAFGPGEQRIYVTEDEFGRVETFDVGTGGLRLYT